jgi:hypothetical protein
MIAQAGQNARRGRLGKSWLESTVSPSPRVAPRTGLRNLSSPGAGYYAFEEFAMGDLAPVRLSKKILLAERK